MSDTLKFLFKSNDLQKTNRYGNNPPFIESTAEHTFKLVLMVDYFYKEFELDLNYQKCIHLALYHDFGEMDLAKDVDIKEKSDQKIHESKDAYEKDKIDEMANLYYAPIREYYYEYKEKKTEESLFVQAIDKLDAVVHPLTVGEEIMNHELFAMYADKAIKGFPLFMPIYKELKGIMRERYEKWGFTWEKEYDAVFEEE